MTFELSRHTKVIALVGLLVAAGAGGTLLLTHKRSASQTAKANIRFAIPAAESYYQDHVNNAHPITYQGLTRAMLRTEAPEVSVNVRAGSASPYSTYCIEDTEGTSTYHYTARTAGPATIMTGHCDAAYGVA